MVKSLHSNCVNSKSCIKVHAKWSTATYTATVAKQQLPQQQTHKENRRQLEQTERRRLKRRLQKIGECNVKNTPGNNHLLQDCKFKKDQLVLNYSRTSSEQEQGWDEVEVHPHWHTGVSPLHSPLSRQVLVSWPTRSYSSMQK